MTTSNGPVREIQRLYVELDKRDVIIERMRLDANTYQISADERMRKLELANAISGGLTGFKRYAVGIIISGAGHPCRHLGRKGQAMVMMFALRQAVGLINTVLLLILLAAACFLLGFGGMVYWRNSQNPFNGITASNYYIPKLDGEPGPFEPPLVVVQAGGHLNTGRVLCARQETVAESFKALDGFWGRAVADTAAIAEPADTQGVPPLLVPDDPAGVFGSHAGAGVSSGTNSTSR